VFELSRGVTARAGVPGVNGVGLTPKDGRTTAVAGSSWWLQSGVTSLTDVLARTRRLFCNAAAR
jgi:hypothetical protein